MSTTLTIPLAIISLVVLKSTSTGTVQLNERQFHIQEGHYVEGHSVYTGRDIIVQECILRCLDIEWSDVCWGVNMIWTDKDNGTGTCEVLSELYRWTDKPGAAYVSVESKYLYIKRTLTHYEAAVECRKWNMDLVSIDTADEVPLVRRLLKVSDECHTSGNFTGKPGQFVWSTGVMLPPPGDPLWQPGQPAENNWNFSCVTMIKTNTSLYFNDAECHIVAHAMCEKY